MRRYNGHEWVDDGKSRGLFDKPGSREEFYNYLHQLGDQRAAEKEQQRLAALKHQEQRDQLITDTFAPLAQPATKTTIIDANNGDTTAKES